VRLRGFFTGRHLGDWTRDVRTPCLHVRQMAVIGTLLSQLPSDASIGFPAKLLQVGFESRTCNIPKRTKQFTKRGGHRFHNVKSNVVVHA